MPVELPSSAISLAFTVTEPALPDPKVLPVISAPPAILMLLIAVTVTLPPSPAVPLSTPLAIPVKDCSPCLSSTISDAVTVTSPASPAPKAPLLISPPLVRSISPLLTIEIAPPAPLPCVCAITPVRKFSLSLASSIVKLPLVTLIVPPSPSAPKVEAVILAPPRILTAPLAVTTTSPPLPVATSFT